MVTYRNWCQALRTAVQDLLRQSAIPAPPIDALAVARGLQLTVAWDQSQPGRGRIMRIAGQPTIFLRPDARPERVQWAAAHELGEAHLWKICRSLGVSGEDLSPHQREDLANWFARELLLPAMWFEQDSRSCDYDLPQLKTRYFTASHELIACRWLDSETRGMVTVFDQGVATLRRNNLPTRVPFTEAEKSCWSKLRQTRQSLRLDGTHMTVRGWCVDSPGWQREILYARISGDERSDDS